MDICQGPEGKDFVYPEEETLVSKKADNGSMLVECLLEQSEARCYGVL